MNKLICLSLFTIIAISSKSLQFFGNSLDHSFSQAITKDFNFLWNEMKRGSFPPSLKELVKNAELITIMTDIPDNYFEQFVDYLKNIMQLNKQFDGYFDESVKKVNKADANTWINIEAIYYNEKIAKHNYASLYINYNEKKKTYKAFIVQI